MGFISTRDVKKKEKYAYLMELEGSDRIEFFAADLNDKNSFRLAFEGGIECVLHIASPYVVTVEDPQRDLVGKPVSSLCCDLLLRVLEFQNFIALRSRCQWHFGNS